MINTKREVIEQELKELFENTKMFVDTSMIVNSEYEYIQDDFWFETEEIDEILYGKKPGEIINLTICGNFNLNDDYFKFDGYGNLESFNDLYDFYETYFYDLIDTIIENIEDLDGKIDSRIVDIVLNK